MPLLEKTAGLTGGPSKGAHTDSGAAFVPDQSRAERPTSFDVADFPVPNGREEEWRFAPVARLAPLFAADTDGVLNGHGVLTTVVEAPEVQVEIVDRDDAAEAFGQTQGPDHRGLAPVARSDAASRRASSVSGPATSQCAR